VSDILLVFFIINLKKTQRRKKNIKFITH
jgi:hypothetical protein